MFLGCKGLVVELRLESIETDSHDLSYDRDCEGCV